MKLWGRTSLKWNLVMHGWDMKRTSIPNKLNHKLQGHGRGVWRNKELDESNYSLRCFAVQGLTLKSCRRTVMLPIKLNFTSYMDCSQHKGISTLTISSNACISQVLVVFTETSTKNCRLAGSLEWLGWFITSLGCWFYSVKTC